MPAQLIGGDRVISAPVEINPAIIALIKQNNLTYNQETNFYSMLSTDSNLMLSYVKAVDPKIGPSVGTIWLEPRIAVQLEVNIGDKISVGDTTLTYTQLIKLTPDLGVGGLSFAPRALINSLDLAKTNVVQPGSRVVYKLFVSGTSDNLLKFDQAITSLLTADYKIQTPNSQDSTANKNIQQAEQYLYIAVLINMLLAALVISITAHKYIATRIKDAAIMRCMGASSRSIFNIYGIGLFGVALILGLLGSTCGFIIQQILAVVLKYTLELQLPLPGWQAFAYGIGSSVFLILIVSLPSLLALLKVSPMQVLRKNHEIRKTFNLQLIQLPAILRLSIKNIIFNANNNLIQVFAFGLVICVAIMLFVLRTQLLVQWQSQLPSDTPNYFAINIAEEDISDLQRVLLANNIAKPEFYPLVRGRLIKINQQPVRARDDDQNKREGINRPLNLTWTSDMPSDNTITAGQWFNNSDFGKHIISIEQTIAERLQVAIGDELTFLINMQEISAIITSIRTVRWDSFHPNFYVVYPPGVLDKFAATYITSFYIPPANEDLTIDLVRKFPEINLLSISAMLDQAKKVLDLIAWIVGYIWIFTVLISILLLFAVVLTGMRMRNYQNSLMRTLGASKIQLQTILGLEYILLGSLSGIVGAIAAVWIARYATMRFIQTSYILDWKLMVIGGIAGALIMFCAGFIGAYRVFKLPPVQLFRNLN